MRPVGDALGLAVGDMRGLVPGLPVGDIIGDPVGDGDAPMPELGLEVVLEPVPEPVPDVLTVADGEEDPEAPELVPDPPERPLSSLQAPVKSARLINPAATA